MSQLTPIQLEDGTIIYIEASENIAVSIPQPPENENLDFLIPTPEQADRSFGLEKLALASLLWRINTKVPV